MRNTSEGRKRVDDWVPGNCRSNGIDIQYIRTERDKPPLIALHGLIGSGACLLPLARRLQAEFDVLLPDARGHGLSSAPEAGYLYDDLASDVVGLIEELRLDAPVLVGHSMGGMTAAVAATRLGKAMRALVLVDPTFISPEFGNVDTAEFNRQVYDHLRPGGIYLIVDHEVGSEIDPDEIAVKHRIARSQVVREVSAAGFILVAEGKFLNRSTDDHTKPIFDPSVQGRTDQYALKFVRPPSR